MPSNPPYDDDWSGDSRNLETGEIREHPTTPIPPTPAADDVIKVGGAALSWDGHNVFGSTTSIELVKRYMHEAGTVPAFREQIAKLTADVGRLREKCRIYSDQQTEDGDKRLALEDESTRMEAPVSDEENFHFEREDVLNTLTGTEHLKANVRRHLSTMTSGEQWSLYRAIAKMVIASRANR